MKVLLGLAITILILCSCNRTYVYEYIVFNNSDRSVLIQVSKLDAEQVDSNVITPGQTLIVDEVIIEERNAERATEELFVPLSFMEISDLEENVAIACDEGYLTIECWGGNFFDDNRDTDRTLRLRIFENSFQ